MSPSGKQIVIGGAALVALSFAVAFAISSFTGDSAAADACERWNDGAVTAAKSRALELQTAGADAAVFLDLKTTESDRNEIEAFVAAQQEVRSSIVETDQEAYQKFSELFANEPSVVANTSPLALPYSIRVVFRAPDSFAAFKARVDGRPEVDEVRDDRSLSLDATNYEGPLHMIRTRGYYLNASGERVALPAGC